MNIIELNAVETKKKLDKKELSSSEIAQAYLDRIQSRKNINAYVSVFEDAVEIGKSKGGLPIAIKDNMNIKGKKTTCGSKILENFTAPFNASVIENLDKANFVYLGKTNMDEFAMGSSTETSYFGPTLNPHDTERIPGGSSGGSAAAVADNQTLWALGSDTGGSIRQPASLCGIVGLKPTYGLVSRYGLVAFASSLDQIGPMTKTVKDNALLLNSICGYDKKDSTSLNIEKRDYRDGIEKSVQGLKIGLPKEYFIEGIDSEVKDKIMQVAHKLEEEGAIIEEVSLPHTEYAVPVYYIIAPSEASSNLSRFDGVRYGYRSLVEEAKRDLISMYTKTRSEGFGDEVKRRILIGTFSLSSGYYDAYYLKAQKVRTLIKQDFDKVFEKYDCLLTPTTPTTAFKIGEKINDPLQMYLSDVFTLSVNLAGVPGISVPIGFSKDKLPIGAQLISKHLNESVLLRVAYNVEQLMKK